MIVKDEEKNLRRCLESLKPVIDAIETELIIVDTGSIDRTTEIAYQYTKQVYFHKWNNSFSDMRNISISYARGEWIFIIDADEELENPEALINLVRSRDVYKYNTVRLKEKNLTSIKLWKYVVHITERLFKNDGCFRYHGSIHNQPVYKHPVLNSEVWLVHYGYDNEDKDLLEKKFKRTGDMLKRELEINPDNIYYRFQLARTFFLHKDKENALEEIQKAYYLLKEKHLDRVGECYYVLGEYAKILSSLRNNEETIKICKEGLKYRPEYIDLYCYLGFALFALEDEQEGIEAFKNYFGLCKKYDEGQFVLSEYTAVELYTVSQELKAQVAQKLVAYLYQKDLYSDVLDYVDYITDSKTRIQYTVRIYINLCMYNELKKSYKDVKNETEKQYFVLVIEDERKSLNMEVLTYIESVFASEDDSYTVLNMIRREKSEEYVKKFISLYDFNKLTVYPYIDVIKEMYNFNINIIDLFKKISGDIIKRYVKVLIDQSGEYYDFFLKYLLDTRIHKDDYHGNRVFVCVANVLLLNYIEKAEGEIDKIYDNIFTIYVDRGVNYINMLYQAERFRITYKTLEKTEDRMLSIMSLANEARHKGNHKIAAKYFLEAAEIYPYMSGFINKYIRKPFC